MILIGQYDSPFVRRVGIALSLYGLAFEHRPWSTFGDAALIRPYNPLSRVPTLVLEDGTALVDSHLILVHLDAQVPAERALMPAEEPAQRQVLRLIGLATGLADAAVSLFYELRLHDASSAMLTERRSGQIRETVAVLEAACATATGGMLVGGRLSHADIAAAAALRFLSEAHPALWAGIPAPALAAHAARLEATETFRRIVQPFIPPS